MAAVSVSEELFERYLKQQHLAFHREPLVGGRRPDFLVDCGGQPVACEVYEPEIRIPSPTDPDGTFDPTGGFVDSYSGLRNGLEDRKQDQIKAFSQAGLPVVLVVAETASDIPINPVTMAGAMYGNLQVTFAVGPGVSDIPEPTMRFGEGGRVQPRRRTGLSAVAIIEEPTRVSGKSKRPSTVGSGRPDCSGPTSRRQPSWRQHGRSSLPPTARLKSLGRFDSAARAVRLEMIHNPFAAAPYQP